MRPLEILNGRVRLYVADVFAALAAIPDETVDCVVTSPPYWGLRDYSVAGQIGLEPTLGEHLEVMVRVFEEVKRVLKPTGTLWVNYGDCYAAAPNGRSAADTKAAGSDDRTFRDKPFSTVGAIYDPAGGVSGGGKRGQNKGNAGDRTPTGRIVSGAVLKPKDLVMVPNRLAIALQEAGWWVRSEIVWAKPNPMPESITDRPGSAHEKIFMLTKAPRYFYDAAAVRVAYKDVSVARLSQPTFDQQQGGPKDSGAGNRSHKKALNNQREKLVRQEKWKSRREGWEEIKKQAQYGNRRISSLNENWLAAHEESPHDGAWPRGMGRNLRNYEPAPLEVWNISTKPFKGAHFATFPPDLAARAVIAGCPKRCCPTCGKPWEPIVTRVATGWDGSRYGERAVDAAGGAKTGGTARSTLGSPNGHLTAGIEAIGERPTCGHYAAEYAAAYPPPRSARKRRQRAAWPDRMERVTARPGRLDWPSVRGIVLDPFGGAGTTGLVAARLGRDAILCELNPAYAEIARERIEDDWRGDEGKALARGRKAVRPADDGLPLFAAPEQPAEASSAPADPP